LTTGCWLKIVGHAITKALEKNEDAFVWMSKMLFESWIIMINVKTVYTHLMLNATVNVMQWHRLSSLGLWHPCMSRLALFKLKSHVLCPYWYNLESNDAGLLFRCSESLLLDQGFDVNGPIHICYRDNRRESAGCLATDENGSKHQNWMMTESRSRMTQLTLVTINNQLQSKLLMHSC